MKRPISLPRTEGRISRQAHVDVPQEGHEREIGRDGFAGPASHMIHAHPPTGWSCFEGPLRPRAYDTGELKDAMALPWDAPVLLANAHLELRFWVATQSMKRLVRNADGDQLLFVHEGSGSLFCDYGHLPFREGDYLILPRGTAWRLELAEPVRVLMVEATRDQFGLPDRGLLGQHALFDPAQLETPRLDEAFDAQRSEDPWQVVVKGRGATTTVTYPWNPLDALGWKGELAPVRLNWRDIRPVSSARYHLPPSAHTTFVADRFAVCTFCPRPLESDPRALNLPFFHSNDDVDELLFYHRGQFTSRDDAGPGMLSFHPAGFPHGPHPKAREAAAARRRASTDEVAVMIDAFDPLEPGAGAAGIERQGYADSWQRESQ